MAQILGPNERRGIQDFEINQQGTSPRTGLFLQTLRGHALVRHTTRVAPLQCNRVTEEDDETDGGISNPPCCGDADGMGKEGAAAECLLPARFTEESDGWCSSSSSQTVVPSSTSSSSAPPTTTTSLCRAFLPPSISIASFFHWPLFLLFFRLCKAELGLSGGENSAKEEEAVCGDVV
ncbi:hypothetical protein K443DRAFT_7385 [Laccaria amethystina LaAM-08-1]|uniref:Uncharacterized protein n=1 Tax=Laccaria amethystina LaAM-08-1 TaxID=1095629 RepID=A0A0C9XGT3_9AGAR|nr:hypothetical protein K443DRAFT_7385 [Laccaria amethystina LaAM-08-1]